MRSARGSWLSRTAVLVAIFYVAGVGLSVAATQAASAGLTASGSHPAGRAWPSLAYDPCLGAVVLFGGDNGSTVYGDTWIYRYGAWTQEHPAVSPAARTGAALVFDADGATGTGILYGGFNGATVFTDTWAWDGSSWTQLSTTASPGQVQAGWQMADDAATGQLLLFGGHLQQTNTNGRATWAWDGTTWTRLSPAQSPCGRGHGSMTYDSATRQIILFGGQGYQEDTYPADTWA